MNYNNLPEEMRAMPNWSCYKTYTNKEGKRKKVIISPKDGNSTFGTFAIVCSFMQIGQN